MSNKIIGESTLRCIAGWINDSPALDMQVNEPGTATINKVKGLVIQRDFLNIVSCNNHYHYYKFRGMAAIFVRQHYFIIYND